MRDWTTGTILCSRSRCGARDQAMTVGFKPPKPKTYKYHRHAARKLEGRAKGCRGDTRPAPGSKLTLPASLPARTVDGYHPSRPRAQGLIGAGSGTGSLVDTKSKG